MRSRKGLTLHWDQIVILLVLVVGVALLLIFIGKVGGEMPGFMGQLIDIFKNGMCQVFGGAFGGLMATMMGC